MTNKSRAEIVAGLANAMGASAKRDSYPWMCAEAIVTAIEQVTAPSPTPGGLRMWAKEIHYAAMIVVDQWGEEGVETAAFQRLHSAVHGKPGEEPFDFQAAFTAPVAAGEEEDR